MAEYWLRLISLGEWFLVALFGYLIWLLQLEPLKRHQNVVVADVHVVVLEVQHLHH